MSPASIIIRSELSSSPIPFTSAFAFWEHPGDKFQRKLERDILIAQYGKNWMKIPESHIIEIVARHALNPLVASLHINICIMLYINI